MATIYKVDCQNRMPLSIGVQEENLAHGIQFDITPWIEEHGAGAVTANAQRPADAVPYPVIVQQDGNIVTWRPKTADVAIEGTGAFQLIYTVGEVVARTQIWATKIGPSLIGSGDPPEPIDDWLDDMREVAADAQQSANDSAASAQQAAQEVLNAKDEVKNAEAWAVGQRGGVDVPSTDPTYENNAKYWAEQSLANQYGAFIVKSASGDIASFTDGADNVPMKSVNVTITPKQSGSGDPSPSNVRPITGWSEAKIYRTGKNLCGGMAFVDALHESYNTGFVVDETAGTVTYNPTAAEGYWQVIGNGYNIGIHYDFKPNTQYTFIIRSADSAQNAFNLGVSYTDGTNNGGFYRSAQGTDAEGYLIWTSPANKTVRSLYGGAYGVAHKLYYNDIGVFEGVITKAQFEEYKGTTTPVQLGQTVYGGVVNPSTGELTINMAYVSSADCTVGLYDGPTARISLVLPNSAPRLKPYAASVEPNILATNLKTTNKNRVTNADYQISQSDPVNNQAMLLHINSSVNTIPLARDWVANNPFGVAYEIETPSTVQLTPAQVATLLGTNNVWADCGSVAVEYRADPTLAYNELANVIVSLGGNL